MEIPSADIYAPSTVLEDLAAVRQDVETLSVYGRAKRFERLKAFSELKNLWLSGLSEKKAHELPDLPALRRLVIHDYRCASLMALPEIPALRMLAICGSTKLHSIDGIQRYRRLTELILFDNCSYTDLTPLAELVELETLCVEGGFSKLLRVRSLDPLKELCNLRRLRLASIRVDGGLLLPLQSLHRLESVFIAKTFPDAELRALAAALPKAKGEFLDSFRNTKTS